MIASPYLAKAAPDPFAAQFPAAPVAPGQGETRSHGLPFLPESKLTAQRRTELPWRLQFAARPEPLPGAVDVVEAGLAVGLRAMERVRGWGLPAGPVLCCITHFLMHIPVEPDTVHRWYAPQTTCRTGIWMCSTAKQRSLHSTCLGVWLLPPNGEQEYTDSSALLHGLSVTRSAVVHNHGLLYGS